MNEPRDPYRRRVLQMMGTLGGGVVVGGALPAFARGAFAFGEPAGAGAASLLPANAIDVHAHFFNASDASVVGYFTHSSNHDSPLLERFLERMEPVLRRLTRIAPTAAEELGQIRTMLAEKAFGSAAAELRIASRRSRIAAELAREMRDAGIGAEFGSGRKGMEVPLTADQLYPLLNPAGEDAGGDKAVAAAQWDPAIRRYFRFINCMFQERWMNLDAFRKGHEPRGIKAAFGAMVDFNHWYPDPASSSLSEQVELHGLLARQSGGYMLPLVSYNPWSDILSGGAVLDTVRDAIEHHGFIGAKIYPPVGYLPAGNHGFARKDWPPAEQIESRLEAFFSECARLGVPVMAHANSTQGRDDENNGNSGPDGWIELIATLARRNQAPLVNLGHFGGDGTDLDEHGAPNDWPIRFARIMEGSGGDGFYGDLGYWTGLRNCKGADTCAAIKRLQGTRDEFAGIDRRIMYGSDWYMMVKEPDWQQWPAQIAASLRLAKFDLHQVFHDNAMACFGLQPGGANRKRLEAFFSGALPAWMA